MKLAKRLWRSFVNIFSLFRTYFPLEKSLALYLKTLNPLHLKMLCVQFVEIGSVVLEKKMKIWKVYRSLQTTERRSEEPTWAFSSGELKNGKFTAWYGQFNSPWNSRLLLCIMFSLMMYNSNLTKWICKKLRLESCLKWLCYCKKVYMSKRKIK